MKLKHIFVFIIFLFICNCNIFAQTTDTSPEPYKDDEFSQVLKDLRRFEIITLGAMPFVTLDTAIVYNGYKFATGKTNTFNPLATADYDKTEMTRIIFTSLSISAGIGISDYVINLVKRNNIKKRQRMEDSKISIEEIPDAIKIPLPEAEENESEDLE